MIWYWYHCIKSNKTWHVQYRSSKEYYYLKLTIMDERCPRNIIEFSPLLHKQSFLRFHEFQNLCKLIVNGLLLVPGSARFICKQWISRRSTSALSWRMLRAKLYKIRYLESPQPFFYHPTACKKRLTCRFSKKLAKVWDKSSFW